MNHGKQALFRAPEIVLPRIDSTLAKLWAALAERDISGQLHLGSQNWNFAQRGEVEDGVIMGTRVDIRLDGAPLTLCFATRVIDWLEELHDFFDPYEAISPERLALILEHVLSSDLEALEKAWQGKIEILAVRLKTRFDPSQQLGGFDIRGEALGAKFAAYIDAKDRSALTEKITEIFPQRPRRTLNHLKMPVKLYGPITVLSRKVLQSMREGSVLFPEREWKAGSSKVWYIAWSSFIARAKPGTGGYSIDGPEDNFDALLKSHAQGGTGMQGGDGNRGGAGDPTAVVTIELGRNEMTISQIEELRQGAILDFDIDRVEEVTVTAGGAAIAIGRLVQLDNTVGVQVTRLL